MKDYIILGFVLCVMVDFEFWSVALRKKEAPARKQPREVPAADTFKNKTKVES